MTVHMLKFSGSYKGSWLLKAAPIKNQSAAYSGALKAFLVKLYLPVFLLLRYCFYMDIFTERNSGIGCGAIGRDLTDIDYV